MYRIMPNDIMTLMMHRVYPETAGIFFSESNTTIIAIGASKTRNGN